MKILENITILGTYAKFILLPFINSSKARKYNDKVVDSFKLRNELFYM